jgi:RecB family endonuclease NucS
MTLYRVADKKLEAVQATSFAGEGVQERRDLQRLLRSDISALGDDLFVLAEEFSNWQDSSRRIDLLCLDRQARLVVVEIKRTDDGGHMELQAIRYAAMVSSMTLDQAIAAHAQLLGGDDARTRAESEVLDFLDLDSIEEAELTDEVRIILVSADFSTEVTTSVLWLNKRGLEVTCIRLKPYRLGEQLLVDVAQIIPLPEAADYEVKVREQAKETQKVRTVRQDIFRRFWAQLIEKSRMRTQLFANRNTTTDHWLSAGIGRAGFGLNLVLTKDRAQAECYISINKDSARSEAAFRALEAQRVAVEAAFGDQLQWEELPGRTGCRISYALEGGWHMPETEWPQLQDQLIDAALRFDKALRGPIQALKI